MLFRRRIVIQAQNDQEVRAALEDDFHHFRVSIRHNSEILTDIKGWAVRFPYDACPSAANQLRGLLGMPLSDIAHSVNRQTDAKLQCTHLLDLAGLAIAAAAANIEQRHYEIAVPQRLFGATSPSLWRDGELYLTWQTQGTEITAPPTYAGIDLNHGMAGWAIRTLSTEEAEAALILRRCTTISRGREYDLDANDHAAETGLCYAQQPIRAKHARRMVGSTLDFGSQQELLCATDQAWLNGDNAS
jgi:hypothetical protein